jgi:hypothetical protein
MKITKDMADSLIEKETLVTSDLHKNTYFPILTRMPCLVCLDNSGKLQTFLSITEKQQLLTDFLAKKQMFKNKRQEKFELLNHIHTFILHFTNFISYRCIITDLGKNRIDIFRDKTDIKLFPII